MVIRCLAILLGVSLNFDAVLAESADSCSGSVTASSVRTCSDVAPVAESRTLSVGGRLTTRVYRRLAEALEHPRSNIARIELDSSGGDVDASRMGQTDVFRVATLIRENRITTVVPDGAVCASACTLLFQAGVDRRLGTNAKLVYHGVKIVNAYYVFHYLHHCRKDPQSRECGEFTRSWYKDCEKATREFYQTLQDFGSSPALYRVLTNLPDQQDPLKNYNCFGKPDLVVELELALAFNVATAPASNALAAMNP